jgi:hypothetical protein
MAAVTGCPGRCRKSWYAQGHDKRDTLYRVQYTNGQITSLHMSGHNIGVTENRRGRALAQVVSRRPPTAEARFRSRLSPCGIYGGQSGTGTGFSPSSSVFPCQFHSTGAPLLGKGQKIIIIIIFITGLHKKPQGCGASVASAAGPFTSKKQKTKNRTVRTFTSCLSTLCCRHFALCNQTFN